MRFWRVTDGRGRAWVRVTSNRCSSTSPRGWSWSTPRIWSTSTSNQVSHWSIHYLVLFLKTHVYYLKVRFAYITWLTGLWRLTYQVSKALGLERWHGTQDTLGLSSGQDLNCRNLFSVMHNITNENWEIYSWIKPLKLKNSDGGLVFYIMFNFKKYCIKSLFSICRKCLYP